MTARPEYAAARVRGGTSNRRIHAEHHAKIREQRKTMTLAEIAKRWGVSVFAVQTVLRGGK